MLCEPPLRQADHTAVTNRIERLIRAGERAQALAVFMQEVVQISAGEVAAMKGPPSWPGLVATIESQIRHFEP